MANSGSVVSIIEGMSISLTISCTSIGAPTPSIVWMLDGHQAPFTTNDIITKESVATTLNEMDQRIFSIVLGSITSNLHVVNARYPDHDGVYTCVGTNSYKMVNTSSSDNIIVQVLGKPN